MIMRKYRAAPSTGGSNYNIGQIRDEELDFGVAQSDWQYHAYNAEFHLMTVVPFRQMPVEEDFFPKDFEEKVASSAAGNLEKLAEMGRDNELEVNLHISSGTIYKEIFKMAKDNAIDLIVLASHQPELSDYLLGPNAAKVVRHAKCSIMGCRTSRRTGINKKVAARIWTAAFLSK